jgi:CheY-like chemotaxis protein
MNGGGDGGTYSSLWMPDPAQLRELRDILTLKEDPANSLDDLAQQVHQEKPDLVVLDLRLCGSAEFATPPAKSTGMELARRLRVLAPFLPILLFTASNKAETLLISKSYDVDEYWLKPGLGEHRGLGSREVDITSLADKIERLLGPDYCWLQRMAQELSIIKTATAQAWWWERDIQWPNPVRPDGKAINGLQPAVIAAIKQQPSLPEIRTSVIELLRPILESFRIALRLEQRDSSVPAPLAPHLLRAGVFNQIGKIVELIHGFTDRSAVPDEFQKAGTVGGRKDVKDDCFVFFRQDWLAFRLFSQRNEWSHVRLIDQANVFAPLNKRNVKAPSKADVVNAMSDLVAWLTVPRLKPRRTEVAGPDGERFRLSPGDSLAPEVRSWTRLSSRAAASASFRACLVGRLEYGPFVVKSQELLQCFHQKKK